MFDAVSIWQEHIRVLSEDIGPRGSTTEGERRGAEYCAQVLRQLELAPQVEPFTAVGLVLTLTQQLRDEPLHHTRVWLVCTGCEEVQHD